MSIPLNNLTEEQNILLLVDGLNLAFRWKHSGAREFYKEYLKTIESLKKSYKAKYVIVATDKGSSSYRKSLYPEYKGNRSEKFEAQTDTEKELAKLFFEDYNQALDYITETTTYPVISFQGVEADDIAAYIVQILRKNLEHIWLISSDTDWDLLVDDKVSRFSYTTRKEITSFNWDSVHEYTQDEYLSIKCLTGDPGDNIKGVEGIGPKRAVSLVKEYGSTLDIVDAIPIKSHLKFINNLNNSKDLLLLNYQLIDLKSYSELAIGDKNIKSINSYLERYIVDG